MKLAVVLSTMRLERCSADAMRLCASKSPGVDHLRPRGATTPVRGMAAMRQQLNSSE